jgi:hypothetical protein
VTEPAETGSFWGRATVAAGLALYGWALLAVHLYLAHADIPEGPERGLALFRRMVMGRGLVMLGGASVIAAIVLALLARRLQRWRVVALILCIAWIAAVVWFRSTLRSAS